MFFLLLSTQLVCVLGTYHTQRMHGSSTGERITLLRKITPHIYVHDDVVLMLGRDLVRQTHTA